MTKKSSRDRIVTAAGQLMQQQGYHGSGMNQIIARAEAPKGSLYFHFPGGKSQLAAEALDQGGQQVARLWARFRAETAGASIDAYLEALATRMERSGWREGCPIATVMLEVAPESDEIAAAGAEAYDRLCAVLQGWLEADGMAQPAARDTAFAIYAALEGALIFAKAQRSRQPLDRLRALLPGLLAVTAPRTPP